MVAALEYQVFQKEHNAFDFASKPNNLLASLYNHIVNPAMVSTVRFYDRNELYGSPDVRNCRMPNFLVWTFFVISLISIN